MESVSSIESRTRASFARVKRDIDTLKSQIAKLRARDDALDQALSDYARSGELYERMKSIDDRFADLSEEYVTASEFEHGVTRLVKETTQLTKRLSILEKSSDTADASAELSAVRKEVDSLSRRMLEKKAFEDFVARATDRIEKHDTTLDRVEERSKLIDALEKRLVSLEKVEVEAKRISEHEKALKRLEGLDPKALEKRLSAIESDQLTKDSVKALVASELENAVRVDELNDKIDEFNAALDSAAERPRVDALEFKVSELEKTRSGSKSDERLAALAADLKDVKSSFADRISALEKTRSVSKSDERLAAIAADLEDAESAFADRISELEKASDVKSDERLSALAADLKDAESKLADRIVALEKQLSSDRQISDKELATTSDEIDTMSSRLSQFESLLAETRVSMDDDFVTIDEFNAKIDEFNAAIATAADGSRFAELESKVSSILERLEDVSSNDVSEMLASERHATNAQITTAIEQIDELAARVDELSDAPRGFDAFEKRLAALESKAPKDAFEGRLDVLSARVDELETSSDLSERISDLEAQLRVVIDDLGDTSGSMNERVIENLARDVSALQSRIEEISEDLEMVSSKKSAQRVESVDHLQSEIEFLRTNVAMQADIESLRSELSTSKGAKKDSGVAVLSEDVQRLIERQSELEKKILSFETRSKREPDVQISERVPLREPKKKAEVKVEKPKPEAKPKEPAKDSHKDENPGAVGKVKRWMVDFFTEEVDEKPKKKGKDELY